MAWKLRSRTGNMLFVAVVAIAAILIPLVVLICKFCPYLAFNARAENVVEAAAMVAATDLSRIIINDEEFGYVSLSNRPATGKATCAQDGEPLPVTGINTLIATVRQNAIIAEELHNKYMEQLVDKDLDSLKSTIRDLNHTLSDAASGYTREADYHDINGESISPMEDVRKFLAENLPPNMELVSVNIRLGWLDGGGETTIAVPQPVQLAQVKPKAMQSGQYEAFMNIPVGHKAFTFAGVGPQVHLVSNKNFRDADSKHISTIVRLECTLVSKTDPSAKTICISCAQPYSHPDQSMRGAMTVRFTGRAVAGLLDWSEFLREDNFQDNSITKYAIAGGDYPYERDARMQRAWTEPTASTSQQFAEHFYCWLRANHARARIDAILAMVHHPFTSSTINDVYIYEIADDGSIVRSITPGNHFSRSVIAEGQAAATTDTHTRGGVYAVVMFRDNVRNLGTDSGKHAGQPLAGYPLGAVDGMIDHEKIAQTFSQRQSHASGLALDIEIGGTGDSTAQQDVISMQRGIPHKHM